jgi:hypothetical protein
LKATEVASEPIASERRATDDAAAVSGAPTAAESPQPKTESKSGGGVPPHTPGSSKRPIWGKLPGGLSLPLIGTAAAAGIVFFLLGLATANLFVGREVAADARLERTQAVDDLSERLAKIETALAAPRAPDTGLIGRIAAAEAAAKLATEHAAVQQRRAEELAALVREARSRADAAAASAEMAQKGSGVAASESGRVDDALNQRIAALEQALKTNEAELARRTASAAEERKNRIAVVASVLLGAVERGAPFATELAAAKALSPDAGGLAPLEPFAASGVPSAASLSRELSGTIPAMLKIVDSENQADGSFLGKLQANAERLGALNELSKLPAHVRAPAEAWIKKANARNAALAVARQFSSGALAAIGKPNT